MLTTYTTQQSRKQGDVLKVVVEYIPAVEGHEDSRLYYREGAGFRIAEYLSTQNVNYTQSSSGYFVIKASSEKANSIMATMDDNPLFAVEVSLRGTKQKMPLKTYLESLKPVEMEAPSVEVLPPAPTSTSWAQQVGKPAEITQSFTAAVTAPKPAAQPSYTTAEVDTALKSHPKKKEIAKNLQDVRKDSPKDARVTDSQLKQALMRTVGPHQAQGELGKITNQITQNREAGLSV